MPLGKSFFFFFFCFFPFAQIFLLLLLLPLSDTCTCMPTKTHNWTATQTAEEEKEEEEEKEKDVFSAGKKGRQKVVNKKVSVSKENIHSCLGGWLLLGLFQRLGQSGDLSFFFLAKD